MPQPKFRVPIYRPTIYCECSKCKYWRTVDRGKFIGSLLLIGIPVILFLIWIVK